MSKGIYTYYRERLVGIGGNNKCLHLRSTARRMSYDVGCLLEGRKHKIREFNDFLWERRKGAFSLICEEEKSDILKNLASSISPAVDFDESKKGAPTLEGETSKIKEIKREAEAIEKETGRYELYVGYPFVFGNIKQGAVKTVIKAPLLLFPVRVEITADDTVELRLVESDKVRINPALVFTAAQSKKISLDDLELEFDGISVFKNISEILNYLKSARINIEFTESENIYGFNKFKEPDNEGLSLRYTAVLGRFPLSSSIYNDYALLERKNMSNDAVNALLKPQKAAVKATSSGRRSKSSGSYVVKMLDYAQSEVVKKVDECGNMVIYGPPGTGKSQTIVNVITDAICKNKRVLVVSQKKAALDVVYNRLGALNRKAMYVNDETKEKRSFYERCLAAHQECLAHTPEDLKAAEDEYEDLQKKIEAETKKLDLINETLNKVRPFGLSLSEMYASSYSLQKNSKEYTAFLRMAKQKKILALTYKEIKDAIFGINSMNLTELYYAFMQKKDRNPLIDAIRPNADIQAIGEAKLRLDEVKNLAKPIFNVSKHPYYREVIAYYPVMKDAKKFKAIVNFQRKLNHPYKIFNPKLKAEIKNGYLETYEEIESFCSDYDFLKPIMTSEGYLLFIDNVLKGNLSYVGLLDETLENYVSLRDENNYFASLDIAKQAILSFAYSNSTDYDGYLDLIEGFLHVRIFHEILKYEEEFKDTLGMLVDYGGIASGIYRLKEAQLSSAAKLCAGKNCQEYKKLFEGAKDNKDYFYQISKKQKLWSIRKTMEHYREYVMTLFPCWLLSPENVSNLLPLEKNMFDVVIFDEASQVFIESTIPTIFRGKSIVVAGDDKQLRPSATFMKRYLGADPEVQDDLSVQAALEVESLLDLAVARYNSANLTYHYRSQHEELISFSNYAFYNAGLQIAPNISRNTSVRPIERYKVDGKWLGRKNRAEADKIVEILKDIFATRKKNESIGIITFNTEQQTCIADAIDEEAAKNAKFRSDVMRETHRIDGGEDTGMFIKNLENVQGDERDIIIFSIGYAENETGKVYASFGSLSTDGGENRLNVAITRAKSRIIVVTSIEPEDLHVEGSKNAGPKLLQKYLKYVRAVSAGNSEEASCILEELREGSDTPSHPENSTRTLPSIEEQIRDGLVAMGYTVDLNLGNKSNRISLAVYDETKDRYLVGVILDKDAFSASDSTLERDVYKPKFLESRGWSIIRVWSRDWWHSQKRTLEYIAAAAEKNR